MTIIPRLGRPRQGYQEVVGRLDYIIRPCFRKDNRKWILYHQIPKKGSKIHNNPGKGITCISPTTSKDFSCLNT